MLGRILLIRHIPRQKIAMIPLITLILLLCELVCFCEGGNLQASQLVEQTLVTTLLNGYNRNIRPSDQVVVDITAELQQIISIDEKQQIMTSSSFISQTWYDDRLSWTPNASNNNIRVVMLLVKSLWIPDTLILNSADSNGYLTVSDYSLGSVAYTGEICVILPALTIRTRCNLFVQKFPFDKQVCSINFTSWSQGTNRISYIENVSAVIDTTKYVDHPLWRLNRTDMVVNRAKDRVPFEDTYNDVIAIELYLQRKPLFFIMNGIFACFILNCVTLLSYILPFGSQVSLCTNTFHSYIFEENCAPFSLIYLLGMVCFMTYAVYSLNFSNLFPQQSEYLMMITLYFLLSMSWTLISMIWFMICNYFTTKSEMPKSLYGFCGVLQKVFFCCFSASEKGDTTAKKKDLITENVQDVDVTNNQKAACISCRKLFPSCFQRQTKVESIENSQKETSVEPMGLVRRTAHISVGEAEEPAKLHCKFCNRCDSCEADRGKETAKDRNRKDIAARCNALNFLIFLFVFIFMLVSNMVLWISMSQSDWLELFLHLFKIPKTG